MIGGMAETHTHFRYRTRVEFSDTDMAGIMHFSNFFRFMERAEHAFWRSLGLSVHEEIDGRLVSWPRVHAACDYKRPLRFEDEVEIEVEVEELRSKAIVFGFRFQTTDSDVVSATGKITAVCTAFDKSEGRMRAIQIPDSIADKLRSAAA
jgi:acyl-CoA thioester hydrolase